MPVCHTVDCNVIHKYSSWKILVSHSLYIIRELNVIIPPLLHSEQMPLQDFHEIKNGYIKNFD